MKLETITPRKAAEWLKLNINNRPLSEMFVRDLVAIISAGQWRVNGDPIRFDLSGNLTDGQHRLAAIFKAGKPVQSWVLRGLEASAFDSSDRGHKRTNGDILARRGESHYNMLAAAANNLSAFFGDGSHGRRMRPDELDQILLRHGELLRVGCSFTARNYSRIIPPAELACLYAVAAVEYGTEVVESFWLKVLTAEQLVRGSAQHTLFRRLTDDASGPSRLRKRARMAICVKAFNAWLTDQKIKCLKYAEGEEFPRFIDAKKVKRNA